VTHSQSPPLLFRMTLVTYITSSCIVPGTATTYIYPLSLHDALPISEVSRGSIGWADVREPGELTPTAGGDATISVTVISCTPGFCCGGVRCFMRVRFCWARG